MGQGGGPPGVGVGVWFGCATAEWAGGAVVATADAGAGAFRAVLGRAVGTGLIGRSGVFGDIWISCTSTGGGGAGAMSRRTPHASAARMTTWTATANDRATARERAAPRRIWRSPSIQGSAPCSPNVLVPRVQKMARSLIRAAVLDSSLPTPGVAGLDGRVPGPLSAAPRQDEADRNMDGPAADGPSAALTAQLEARARFQRRGLEPEVRRDPPSPRKIEQTAAGQ